MFLKLNPQKKFLFLDGYRIYPSGSTSTELRRLACMVKFLSISAGHAFRICLLDMSDGNVFVFNN